ncbi:MAG: hypothetical protein J6K42_05630 [Clostridia bacterium]|nr:hypothetical protein [Clostridia bacterium]
MKKIKIMSFIVIAMMIFNIIAIPCISNAEEEKIIKPGANNICVLLDIYAKKGAGINEYNQITEKELVDINKVKQSGEQAILFDGEGTQGEYDGFGKEWANDKLEIADTRILRDLDALFYGKINSAEEFDIYIASKKFLEYKLGTISDFSIQLVILGNNGKKFVSTLSDSTDKTNTLGTQYDLDAIEVQNKIISELGGEGKSNDENFFYENIIELTKTVNYVFNANDQKYYLVFGYNENPEDNKDEYGGYKINAYLITDKTMNMNTVTEFDTKLNYEAYIGNKDVGGTNENGTFKPNYDKENVKKDADVTATITSKTDEEIAAVDDVALKNDGSANEKGWYYPDLDNKKIIAKQYTFDKYNNSKDNGIVKEDVVLTGSNGNKDEQAVSIKWPFRIIDITYNPQNSTKDTKEVTVTIETNLPMDPNKVPEGWAIVPDTDNHKITKTFENGEKINTDVTVYQNGTGDSDKTNVKIDWPADDTVAPTPSPNTGETFTMLVVIGIAIFSAVIARKKFKSKK